MVITKLITTFITMLTTTVMRFS